MRTAVTVWNGRIAPVFDVAGTLVLLDTEQGKETGRKELSIPSGAGMMQRVSFLTMNGVDVLICGAVSRQVHRMLAFAGIKVHSFVSGDALEVLQAFLEGSLENDVYRMPGCGMGRCRGEGRGAGQNRRGRNRDSCPAGKRGVTCRVETEQDPSEQDPHGESV